MTELVRDHYEADAKSGTSLESRTEAYLARLPGSMSAADVAGVDQFHVGGLAATIELGGLMGLAPGMVVLDAGSGLGGPARALAERYGCSVTGIDLSPSFVAISRMIAERTGMAGTTRYDVGDLTALPFENASFDAAYSQHVVMNIADRAAVYRELRRVLKPGAPFGWYDVLAADGKPEPHYPVPWAESPLTSHLLTAVETRVALKNAGFVTEAWSDVTTVAMGWAAQQRIASTNPAPNIGFIMGPRMAEMAANLMRNLGEGRLKLIMSVWTAR